MATYTGSYRDQMTITTAERPLDNDVCSRSVARPEGKRRVLCPPTNKG